MRKLIKGQNDFETICKQNNREDLLAEWYQDKNGDLKPSDFLPASNKSVWWKCSNGHEWEARIENRYILGRNCPYCYGRYAVKGKNDLQSLNPELAQEWHPTKNGNLLPCDVKPNTSKKVWWMCNRGHEWRAVIESRSNGVGCPYCSNKKVLKGFNDLATTNPELVAEWDYELNVNLNPDEIVAGSQKKVWWKCEYGHEWKTAVVHRTGKNHTGCPYCTGFGSSMPEQGVAFYLEKVCRVEQRIKIDGKEVDVFLPDYNIGIEYDGVLYHAGKETKDFQKTVHLTRRKIRLIRIKEADSNDVINDSIITFNGHDMNINYVWALNQLFDLLSILTQNPGFKGISVDLDSDLLKIRERFNLYRKENSFAKVNPEIAAEWNYEKNGKLKPDMFFAGSSQKVWWICPKGHEWQAYISNRSKGIGCPYCSGNKAIAGETDLVTTNPQLAAEWNYEKNKGLKKGFKEDISTPDKVTAGSNIKVWWIGNCGHEWDMSIVDRAGYKKLNCPYCSGYRVGKGINDLATINPRLAAEWNYEKNGNLMPTAVTATSNNKVWWKCNKGHEWQATINNRSKGTGCPYCSNKKALKGFNDLSTTNPELAAEWNYKKNAGLTNDFKEDVSTPDKVTAGSSQKVWWICPKGHEWKIGIASRTGKNHTGCPYCGNKAVLIGFNDLATMNPGLAAEWNYEKNNTLKPVDITIGSNKKVWWKCKQGHEWHALVISRSLKHTGCPICAGKQVLTGFNDLLTTNPDLCKEWNYEKNIGISPDCLSSGSDKKVWWRCSVGHEWQSTVSNRVAGHGCPYCHGGVSRKVKCIETGIIYPSATKAAKQLGISQPCLSACCNGKQEVAGGYHWIYVD